MKTFLLIALAIIITLCIVGRIVLTTRVMNNPLNGRVYQVKKYLEHQLLDPKSTQFIKWSKVKYVGGYYRVSCSYRSKNAFGGYVIAYNDFTINPKTKKVIQVN
jgi:hypothetical protein